MKQILSAGKLLAIATTATLLFTSCKKDSAEPNPTPIPGAASKIKMVSSAESEISFAYNAAGQVESMTVNNDLITSGTANTFKVTYGAGGKITELKGNGQSRITPQYGGDVITGATVVVEDGTTSFNAAYSYLNGTLKSVLATTGTGFDLRFDYTVDANGNFTKTDILMQDPTSNQPALLSSTRAQYDGKANPLYELRQLLSLFLIPVSKNNVVKEQDFDDQNQATEVREYNYVYNEKGFPKSATLTTTPTNAPPTLTNLIFQYH